MLTTKNQSNLSSILFGTAYEGHSVFVGFFFAVKARSTTLIFVEHITLHKTNHFDNVHKVLAVFTGDEFRFCIFVSTYVHLIHCKTVDLVLHRH